MKYVYIHFSEERTKVGLILFFLWMITSYVIRSPVYSVAKICDCAMPQNTRQHAGQKER